MVRERPNAGHCIQRNTTIARSLGNPHFFTGCGKNTLQKTIKYRVLRLCYGATGGSGTAGPDFGYRPISPIFGARRRKRAFHWRYSVVYRQSENTQGSVRRTIQNRVAYRHPSKVPTYARSPSQKYNPLEVLSSVQAIRKHTRKRTSYYPK